MLSTSHVLLYLILTTILSSRSYYLLTFMDGEIEAQRGYLTYPMSHN